MRLWHRGAKSYWWDELAAIDLSTRTPLAIVTNAQETNPPLYYLGLHAWTALFGTGELAARLPSALFGVLAAALAGWFGRLAAGRRVGWFCLAFLAVSPMAIQWSQNARAYAPYLCATLAASCCYLRWLRTGRASWAAGTALSLSLSAWLHHYWVFHFAALQLHALSLALRGRLRLRAWLALSAAVIISFLPWLGVVLTQAARIQREGFWIGRPGVGAVEATLRTFMLSPDLSHRLSLAYVALAALGLVRFRRGTLLPSAPAPRRRAALLPALVFVCPIALPVLWSLVRQPIFMDRYAIAALPAFLVLVGRGLVSLPLRPLRAPVTAVVFALALAALPAWYASVVEDWRGLCATIARASRDGDEVFIATGLEHWGLHYPTGAARITYVGESGRAQPAALPRPDHCVHGFLVMRQGTLSPDEPTRASFAQANPGLVFTAIEGFGPNLSLTRFDCLPR
ncbi:MAG: glycosyltransferase family 39 protein [Deltaproteobacteria bacterium]|nr:glycosyltransferase family 39 protein [Deltaproteobacteria bacterium]